MLAAITGFEALKHPTSQDLQQFSNLFAGLFELTREDTRRTAVAALSRIRHLPADVAMMVADQPIRISAPFLALSPCLGDQLLLLTLARNGMAHARAISRREELSPAIVAALSSMDDAAVSRSLRLRHTPKDKPAGLLPSQEATRRYNEDVLRNRIEDLALRRVSAANQSADAKPETGRPDIRQLIRAAESSQPTRFAQLLSRALGAQRSLADRIMLDLSGRQLAMALFALEMHDDDINRVLVAVFPHLGQTIDGVPEAELLIRGTDRRTSIERVMAWVRANAPEGTGQSVRYQPVTQSREDRRAERGDTMRREPEQAKVVKRA